MSDHRSTTEMSGSSDGPPAAPEARQTSGSTAPPQEHRRGPREEPSLGLAWLSGQTPWGPGRVFRIRLLVLAGFTLLSVWIGLEFHHFVTSVRAAIPRLMMAARAGRSFDSVPIDLPARPAGVEAYLPISGLMGLADAVRQGELNAVHPAATVLVATFLLMALLLRRAFCGWVCPVGLISEVVALPLRRRLGRDLRLPRWLDVALRAIKWLLLAFFLWSIFSMDGAALRAFMVSDYNHVADVRMLAFFTSPSRTTLITLGVLLAFSVVVRGAWCRYLCPYGALLGLFSWLSPTKIHRDPEACTSCGRCDRACWARLPISTATRVTSPECSGCLDCVATCPQRRCLEARLAGRLRLSPVAIAALVIGLLLGATLLARATGHWHSSVEDTEWVLRIARAALTRHP